MLNPKNPKTPLRTPPLERNEKSGQMDRSPGPRLFGRASNLSVPWNSLSPSLSSVEDNGTTVAAASLLSSPVSNQLQQQWRRRSVSGSQHQSPSRLSSNGRGSSGSSGTMDGAGTLGSDGTRRHKNEPVEERNLGKRMSEIVFGALKKNRVTTNNCK
jgi:hypothetical protein